MHRIRRPWAPTRRDTDTAQMETSDAHSGEKAIHVTDSKSPALNADADLRRFEALHEFDPNLPGKSDSDIERIKLSVRTEEKRLAIEDAVNYHDVDAELAIEHELEENSPYPEVVAAVRNTDIDVPANTIRAWFLGMIFVTIGSGCNLLFSLRNPSIQITAIVAQLVSYPFGLLMAWGLPTKKFNTFGLEWTLNPGPFNMKV